MAEEIRNKFVSWTLNVVKAKPGTSFYGVGINLSLDTPKNNRVGVDSVEPNGPAAKAGLQPGDIIIEVDKKRFDDGKVYLPDDVAVVIRGPKGTSCNVVVEREGKKVEFVITREPIGVVSSSPSCSPSREDAKNGEKKVTKDTVADEVHQTKEDSGKEKKKSKASSKAVKKTKQGSNIEKKKEDKASCDSKKKKTKQVKDQMKDQTALADADSITSLKLSEDKETDLAASALSEDTDKFDDIAPSGCCNITSVLQRCNSKEQFVKRCNSLDEVSEEKTADNEEISSICNSAGGDSQQWELISERSGSAIVISFNGSISGCSFRSASPSVLKNRFVLEEYKGECLEHVVLPTDTLQGLCLAYKISATKLRMENNFSGNSIQMAPKKLKIPISKGSKGMMIRVQDRSSKEYKLYAFVAEIPSMELVEAKAYLDLSNWDLEESLRSAREDEGFSFGPSAMELSPVLSAVVKPKALTAQDIYSAPPPFQGHGFELKDIKSGGK